MLAYEAFYKVMKIVNIRVFKKNAFSKALPRFALPFSLFYRE